MSVASFGPGSLGCNPPTQEQMQLSQIISLLSTLACKDVASSLNLTTECLQVTVAGAWGEVGDIIQVIRWFDARQIPPTSFYTVYVNTVTNAVVTGVTTSNTTECPTGGDGPISINGIFNFEYFICDNGTPKIVQLCGASCSDYSVNYLNIDRTESTEPSNWNLVTPGVCDAIYAEGIDTGLTDNTVLVSGKARLQIIDQSSVGTDGSIIPFSMDLSGRVVNLPYSNPDSVVQFYVELADKTPVEAMAAGGVGVYNYITDVVLSNSAAGNLADFLLIKSNLTTIGCVGVAADSGNSHSFNIPRKSAANEAINIESNLTSADLKVTLIGYRASI